MIGIAQFFLLMFCGSIRFIASLRPTGHFTSTGARIHLPSPRTTAGSILWLRTAGHYDKGCSHSPLHCFKTPDSNKNITTSSNPSINKGHTLAAATASRKRSTNSVQVAVPAVRALNKTAVVNGITNATVTIPAEYLSYSSGSSSSISLTRQSLTLSAFAVAGGFIVADLAAQLLTLRLDFFRTVRMALYGGFIYGPTAHSFYNWLLRRLPSDESERSIAKRVLVEQLLLTPTTALQLIFLTTIAKGHILRIFRDPISQRWLLNRFALLVLVKWLLWPAVHLFNFRLAQRSSDRDNKARRVKRINAAQLLASLLQSLIVHR